MRTQLLVTSVGEDRPGIVARLTEVFLSHGANLEERRMAILGGEFAAIMLISLATEQEPALGAALAKLHQEGIVVNLKRAAQSKVDRMEGYSSYRIKLTGADHEGIVFRVSSYLKDNSINIQAVDTQVVNAPETGSPLFQMTASLLVPPAVRVAEVRKDLNRIADEESVDIDLHEISTPAAV